LLSVPHEREVQQILSITCLTWSDVWGTNS